MKFSKEEILQTYKHLVKKIWNFLQSPQCREFLFFLFFVFIASAFWILQTLNEEYETEISIPLRIKNVPENVVFTSDIPQELQLKLADKGTVLVNYMLGQGLMPVTLDFEEYKQRGNHIRLLRGVELRPGGKIRFCGRDAFRGLGRDGGGPFLAAGKSQ